MLKKISFQNYKAFAQGEIKIKPITLLLGANSVGKSSIMQLLLLLQQTALSEENYKSALKLHGRYVSLGEGVNLIRKKDIKKVLTIELEFSDSELYKILKGGLLNRFCADTLFTARSVLSINRSKKTYNKENNSIRKQIDKYDELGWRFSGIFDNNSNGEIELMKRNDFSKVIESCTKILEDVDIDNLPEEIENHSLFRSRRLQRIVSKDSFKILKDRSFEYFLVYDLFYGILKDLTDDVFRISYDIMFCEGILVLKRFTIYSAEHEILSVEFDLLNNGVSELKSIKSKYITENQLNDVIIDGIKQNFNNPRTIFSFAQLIEDNEIKTNTTVVGLYFQQLINLFSTSAGDYFENENINYVSPLRAHPKRYYFLDKARANTFVDTLDGDAIAEILKEKENVKQQVNTWLNKFDLKVNVAILEDYIHRLQIHQNKLDLDITDVGFGISQVLPVIIQSFLSKNESLTIIEQPEIHLHPKMQAEMADLFIDVVKRKDGSNRCSKYLLVETHSEYLLKRLRRRISDGSISHEDVAIYLIDPQDDNHGGIIQELEIQEKGHFEWPVDFYGGELIKDSIEYLKNQ